MAAGAQSYPSGVKPCIVVAEAGQNHQGCLDIAKQLILEAKLCGADCIKFQKTCLEEKFNESFLNKKYDSPNSWGATYGDHKRFLEFTEEQFLQLQKYAGEIGIIFFSTAMDKVSVDVLVKMSMPFIKIGSGDSNNLPLIDYAASKHIPLIVSTGMIDKKGVENIYTTVKKYHNNLCLMHCVSAYPTPFEDCNLNVIKDFQTSFPDICIGYSGHEIGISVSLAAVTLGAKIIERHITLDKTQKGSDHSCSLLPSEMKEMISQIRIIEKALGNPIKQIANSERSCIEKLQKSLVAAVKLSKGHILQKDDLKIKVSKPKGMNGLLYDEVIGRKLHGDKSENEPIFETDFII
ncbi:N-acetylneuraminic acid synthase [Arctopsyche grandis]|uniref:N-acetylneuraminic acid synthase n=1 Tax=Arctopsyche grandis TaxID=121162 RepID=UPI00406D90A5